jgi:hypothetical protein
MSAQAKKQFTTSIESFDPKRLSVSDFTVDKSNQNVAYFSYSSPTLGEDSKLLLQSPWIELNSGGIPKLTEKTAKFFKTDRDRAFLNVPFVEGSEFMTKMQQIEKMFSSESFRKEKLSKISKNATKFEMHSIIKIKEQEEGDDRPPLPPSMKVKFDLAYHADDENACEIKTQVYTTSVDENNKRTRELKQISTLKEMEDLVRLGSKVRLIMQPTKMWASSSLKSYGIMWKLMKLEVEPSTRGSAMMKAFYDTDAFLDSDDDEEEVKVSKPSKDDDDNDDDDEEEEEVKPKKVAQKASKKVVEDNDDDDDDDDEEEEEEVKPKKVAQKASKKVVEEDDSDEDSPEIPKKKVKGKSLSKQL